MDTTVVSNDLWFQRSPSALWRESGDEVVVAPPGREDFDVLSPTASAVWRLIETPTHFTDVVDAVARAYSVSPDDVAPDVRTLLADLVHRGAAEAVADGDD
jgi:hypothetical protein